MLLPLTAILFGLIMLAWSADRFVTGAAATARGLGMSLLMIGMTVVSFGTSAPEILVSAIAAATGAGGLAVGNALGSNITNIGLVLGITAVIAAIKVPTKLFRREFLLLFAASALAGWCMSDLVLDVVDGILLISSLVFVLWLFVHNARKSGEQAEIEHEVGDSIPSMTMLNAVRHLVEGLTILLISSRILVWGGTEIANLLGISEVVIGLTIVAIGTSLPELAASVASALKNHHDMAIGTIVGSNLFNLLIVLALPGLFAPLPVESIVLFRDYGAMLLLTAVMIGFAWSPRGAPRIGLYEGVALIGIYTSYIVMLYLTNPIQLPTP